MVAMLPFGLIGFMLANKVEGVLMRIRLKTSSVDREKE
jgi:hypothetical protein